MDKIFINNLPIDTIIGVYSHELNIKQRIILDLELQINAHEAAKLDDITKTLDYASLVDTLQTVCDSKTFKLLESLAEYLCTYIFEHFSTNWIKLSITKPHALASTKDVGVIIERSRVL